MLAIKLGLSSVIITTTGCSLVEFFAVKSVMVVQGATGATFGGTCVCLLAATLLGIGQCQSSKNHNREGEQECQ